MPGNNVPSSRTFKRSVGEVGQAGDVVVAQVQGGQGDEVGQALR